MLFSNRGDEVNMCHFKEIDFGLKKQHFQFRGVPNLLFGRTSLSVCSKWFWANLLFGINRIPQTSVALKGPGGRFCTSSKFCAGELVSVVSRGLPWCPVVSRGLAWNATSREVIAKFIFLKKAITRLNQNIMSSKQVSKFLNKTPNHRKPSKPTGH